MTHRRYFWPGLAVGLVAIALLLMGSWVAPQVQAQTLPQALARQVAVGGTPITVFRSPTCDCCGQWIEHLEAAGFQVQDQITADMDSIKQQYGVPADLATCHTAIADGYVIEGHVPATDVERLLATQPNLAGIAVPGMPMGSPGMEMGEQKDPYSVLAFTREGRTTVFSEPAN